VKIRIADDDAMSRRLLEKTLEREGYEVIAVDNGRLALAHLDLLYATFRGTWLSNLLRTHQEMRHQRKNCQCVRIGKARASSAGSQSVEGISSEWVLKSEVRP
jgi:hypothetical protein